MHQLHDVGNVIFFFAGRTRSSEQHAAKRDIERYDEGQCAVTDVFILNQSRHTCHSWFGTILLLSSLNAGHFIIRNDKFAILGQFKRPAVEFIDNGALDVKRFILFAVQPVTNQMGTN